MNWYKKLLDTLFGVELKLTEDKTTANDVSAETVKETIEDVKNTEEEKIEVCIPSSVLPSIKHKIDIDISYNKFCEDMFRIYFYDKREKESKSVFIYVYENAVDNFKKGLIMALQTYEKWCEFVKNNGCSDGYDKELWSDIKSNLYIGVKYKDGSPKLYILYILEFQNIIFFNSVDEALVYCTEMFEKIGLFVVQHEKEKQQKEKNDDFLDSYQKLLKATQNGFV